MRIFDEYKEYMDSQGLVQLSKDKSQTDNGIRWTTEAFLTIQKNGQMTDEIHQVFTKAILACEDPQVPGLFHRSQSKRNQEGPDDYCALICFAAVSGNQAIAERVLKHGEQQFHVRDIDMTGQAEWVQAAAHVLGAMPIRYNFNDTDQASVTQKSWMGRFPALVCAMKYVAGKNPSFFEQAYFIGSLIFSATRPTTDYDARSLSWFLCQAVEGKNLLIDLAIKWWYSRLNAQYPEGMKTVLSNYFNNPEFPTSKYVKT